MSVRGKLFLDVNDFFASLQVKNANDCQHQ